MFNIGSLKFKRISDGRGDLTPIESETDVPFVIRRVYYMTAVDSDVVRGRHAHRALHQVLVCLNGSITVTLDNTVERQEVVLADPTVGLYVGPYVWREMHDFSADSTLLVLASDHYDESDYIRGYDVFQSEARKHFDE